MSEAELKAQRIADLADSAIQYPECDTPELRAEIMQLLMELGAEVRLVITAANEAGS